MQLVKTRPVYSSSLTILGRLGLEALFFGIGIPGALIYTGAGVAWGTITLLLRPVTSPAFAYGPWKDMASLLRLMWRHIRYIYRFDFLPWRKKRRAAAEKRERAKARLETLRCQRMRHEQMRALVLSSDCDSIDIMMFGALAFQFLPFVLVIPQLIISTIGFISVWSYMPHYQSVVVHAPPLPLPQVVYQMQPADEQEADYGPWLNRAQVIDIVKTSSYLKIALLSDTGSVKYSQHKTGLLDGFVNVSTEKVANIRRNPDGQIAFNDERNNAFAVNPNQVFLLEGDTSFAYVFMPDAQLKAIPFRKLQTKEE